MTFFPFWKLHSHPLFAIKRNVQITECECKWQNAKMSKCYYNKFRNSKYVGSRYSLRVYIYYIHPSKVNFHQSAPLRSCICEKVSKRQYTHIQIFKVKLDFSNTVQNFLLLANLQIGVEQNSLYLGPDKKRNISVTVVSRPLCDE